MIIKLNPYTMTEKQKEDSFLANWAFDSHKWVEQYTGYFKCEWCGMSSASGQSINKDYPLCPQNYVVSKHMKDNTPKIMY